MAPPTTPPTGPATRLPSREPSRAPPTMPCPCARCGTASSASSPAASASLVPTEAVSGRVDVLVCIEFPRRVMDDLQIYNAHTLQWFQPNEQLSLQFTC